MNNPANPLKISNSLLELARPYLYRREGRYSLRVRVKGSKDTCTIALKTTNRHTALATATRLLSTLKTFHLDRLDATREELWERLRDIAEGVLEARTEWNPHGGIDVNENEGKTLKNKFSVRQVPVVDALGFDVEAFEKFAQDAQGSLFTMSLSSFSSLLNERLRAILMLESSSGQSFHSLRHHLAGAMKAVEVNEGTAQGVLGHSSGSITFDLYGSGRSVQVQRMAVAIKVALEEC